MAAVGDTRFGFWWFHQRIFFCSRHHLFPASIGKCSGTHSVTHQLAKPALPKGPDGTPRTWRLDVPVLQLPDTDRGVTHNWSIRDAFEGVQVFGATGSGKTSGSGSALALGLLRSRFGGLVLTAKPTDAEDWAGPNGYLRRAGRSDRPIVVGPPSRWKEYESWGVEIPTGGHRLDFLDYELRRLRAVGINPNFNLVSLFESALEVGRPQEPGGGSEPFWHDTFRQLVQNAVDLAIMADDSVSLSRIKDIVMSAPETQEAARSDAWRGSGSVCWECLQRAQERFDKDDIPEFYDEEDLRQVATYWLIDLAGLAWKTKSNVRTMFTSKVDFLLRSPLRQMFSPDAGGIDGPIQPTFAPEQSHMGRVIILDFPIKSFGEIGRFVQVLYKTLWQMSTEDRKVLVDQKTGVISGEAPVFLWADESQYFVTSRDLAFQLTARSKCVCTVYLTQNLPNYYAMLKGADNRSNADSLLGNLQTKIFHANGDPTTNRWAEQLFSQAVTGMRTRTSNLGSGDRSIARADSLQPVLLSREFLTLRKGGAMAGGLVDAIVFQAGHSWDPKDVDSGHLLRTTFSQSEVPSQPSPRGGRL